MEPIDFHSMDKNTMEVNGYRQLFGYQHSSKYLLLCLTEERVNYDGIFQLNQVVPWWNPLTSIVWIKIQWKSMATVSCLVTNILQNILLLCLTEERVNYDGIFQLNQVVPWWNPLTSIVWKKYNGSQWVPSTVWWLTSFKISSFVQQKKEI